MKIQKEDKKNIFILALWSIVLFLIAKSFRAYYSMDVPPAWDNLAYQLEAVKLARSFFEGDSSIIRSYLGDNIPVGYIFSLSLSYVLFGFFPASPYIISALFGFGNLTLTYLLSVELNVKRGYALLACLGLSTLPNFIYNNFLQTRNDFALSFFILLFLYLLILSLKEKSVPLVFVAGLVSGLGTLFKLSAPGYFIWMYFLFLIIPNDRNDFMTRLKCFFISGIGAFLVCGWYYLPAIKKILTYYSMWGDFSLTQYKLFTVSDRMLFYFKNFLFVHLGSNEIIFTILAILLIGIIFKFFLGNGQRKVSEFKEIFLSQYFLLILGSYAFVIGFMTLKGTYAMVGDIPVIQFAFILLIVFLNYLFLDFGFKRSLSLLFLILPLSILNSYTKIAKEKLYPIEDFELFVNKIQDFREKYAMEDTKFLQVFSHPVYNTTAVAWYLHLKKQVVLTDLVKSTPDNQDWGFILTSSSVVEQEEIIKKYPFLIIPNENPIQYGGEYFVQINILNNEVKKKLLDSGLYNCEDSFAIGKSKFPIRFCLSKNYHHFKFLNKTSDGWVEWGSVANYYSSVNVNLKLKGIPSRDLKTFYLEDASTKEKFPAKFNSVGTNSIYEYEILLPASKSVRSLKLLAEPEQMKPASKEDTRKLALLNAYMEL
ncbi:MAG: glycosyltransferase family 39 protein [Leptospiraceae bacterium]|nr:glycosyltransferase family 39 protein [Leptospiraceae bacterium]